MVVFCIFDVLSHFQLLLWNRWTEFNETWNLKLCVNFWRRTSCLLLNLEDSFAQFSAFFSFMFWHIELKICIYEFVLCTTDRVRLLLLCKCQCGAVYPMHVESPSLGWRLPLFYPISLLSIHLSHKSRKLPLFRPHLLTIILIKKCKFYWIVQWKWFA